MCPKVWQLADANATEHAGAQLAQALLASSIDDATVLLDGDLGAGKTTLVRGLLRALGVSGPVPSPTYTLMEPYECGVRRVFHLDLYRLADADELEFLGWRDLAPSIRFVEWPQRVPRLIEAADLLLSLVPRGSGRELRITGQSATGKQWLASLLSIRD
ncbi:MAG: tRNA (adenosine(37)-N6)-threonylcarbamoyltransferase complex ATPase subunit type 1 TsaE [Pseudomonadota bacterium]